MTTLDVTDYGAVGDGSTDDADAIQDAIEDADAGDTVYVPAGTYNVEGDFAVPVDSAVVADDVTFEGDGEETIVEYGGGNGGSNTAVFRFDTRDGGFSGWEVRDMVVDGAEENVSGDPNVAHAISVVGFERGDITFRNVRVHNAYNNGFGLNGSGITCEHCTSEDNNQHGFSADTLPGDDPITFDHCYSANNASTPGFYNFDVSGGNVLVVDCVSDGSNYHGTKTTPEADTVTYRRCRFNDSAHSGYMRPDVDTEIGQVADVTFEDVIWDGAGRGWYLSQDTRYHIEGEVVITNVGDDNPNCVVAISDGGGIQGAEITGSGHLYVNNTDSTSSFLDYESPESSSIEHVSAANNSGGLDGNGNLSIDTRDDAVKTDIAGVPTAAEVGAWSDGTTDDDSTSDDTPTSTDPGFDAWTPRWAATTDDWHVLEGPGFEGGHALAFQHDGPERTRYAISWDEVGTPADVEVMDRFRVPAFTDDEGFGFHARVHLRSSTAGGAENGYWLEVDSPNDAFRLAKYTDGGLTTLARFGSPSDGVAYHRRFRAAGETIRAKVWPAAEAEPAEWDAEVTDGDHADGWVGVGSYDGELVETDAIAVGVDGASASQSPGDEPPALEWVDPAEGETVSGDVPVAVDASDAEDPPDALTVEYRVDDGSWTVTSYDADAGNHAASWDSTTVSDGTHTLSARVADTAGNTASAPVDVTVDNALAVETVGAEGVTADGTTLVGDLTNLGSASSATGSFEYRRRGTTAWTVVGDRTLSAEGRFETTASDLSADTGYEFRAVVEADDRAAGSTVAFETGDGGGSSLVIDRFEYVDHSNPAWSRYDVAWTVSDPDGALNTVVTELRYGGVTVAAESTNVTGATASHSHELRVKGPVDEIVVTVNDTENDVATESRNV